MPYYVYILRNFSNKLYIGQTNSLNRREKEQLSKTSKSAKYIKDHQGFKLVYYETYPSRKEAMNREQQLKAWTKAKKEALIGGIV